MEKSFPFVSMKKFHTHTHTHSTATPTTATQPTTKTPPVKCTQISFGFSLALEPFISRQRFRMLHSLVLYFICSRVCSTWLRVFRCRIYHCEMVFLLHHCAHAHSASIQAERMFTFSLVRWKSFSFSRCSLFCSNSLPDSPAAISCLSLNSLGIFVRDKQQSCTIPLPNSIFLYVSCFRRCRTYI